MAIFNTVYGGEWKWKPGANTLLYRPLIENANDASGNGNNGTGYGSISYSESNGAYISTKTSGIQFPIHMPQISTISLWIKIPTAYTGNEQIGLFRDWTGSYRVVLFALGNSIASMYMGNGGTGQSVWGPSITYNTSWNNIVITRNGASLSLYKNGELVGTHTHSYNPSASSSNIPYVGNGSTEDPNYAGLGYIKDYIIENKARTADEISAYYNGTKGNYGL